MIALLAWVTLGQDALANRPRVELELAPAQIEDDCLTTPQIAAFLEQIPKWKKNVPSLSLRTDTTFDPKCRKELEARLTKIGFRVTTAQRIQPGLKIEGVFGSEAVAVASEEKAEQKTATDAPSQPGPIEAQPLPAPKVAAAEPEKEKQPEEDPLLKWSVAISPGWLISSGSGIPTNAAGFSSGFLTAEYRLNTRSEVRIELLTPVRSEAAMPQTMMLSGEFSYRFIGEQPFAKDLPTPPMIVSGIAGVVDFTQSPGLAQPLSQYQEGSTILSELLAPYFGASITRPLGRSTTVTAKALLIPVLPISSNTMTLSSRVGLNMDYYLGSFTLGLGASISSFTLGLKDPTPSTLAAVYRWVGVTVKYHF